MYDQIGLGACYCDKPAQKKGETLHAHNKSNQGCMVNSLSFQEIIKHYICPLNCIRPSLKLPELKHIWPFMYFIIEHITYTLMHAICALIHEFR